jgi:hypothetical protein
VIYLTGVSTPETRRLRRADLGILVTPDTARSYRRHLADYPAGFGVDNGCFTNPDRDFEAYLRWVDTLPRAACHFVVAPDVVGDMAATWTRSAPYLARIRALGFPAALVVGDGLVVRWDGRTRTTTVELPDGTPFPWDAADVFFLGGSTAWKVSLEAGRFTDEAVRHGKRVHMGRVNSFERLELAAIACATADGTFLAFGPRANLPRLLEWLDALEWIEPGMGRPPERMTARNIVRHAAPSRYALPRKEAA